MNCRWPKREYGFLAATFEIPVMLWGRVVETSVTRLELAFEHGKSVNVPLRNGFFLFRVPDRFLARGAPTAVIGYDGKGTEFAREEFPRPRFYGASRGIGRPPGGAALARKRRAIAIATDLGRARVWTAPSYLAPTRCWWLEIGRRVFGGGCRRDVPYRRALPSVVPARLELGGKTTNLLWGRYGPRVSALEVEFQDGERARVHHGNGFFLYEIPRDRYDEGRRPAYLVALDVNGDVLARELLVEYTAGGFLSDR